MSARILVVDDDEGLQRAVKRAAETAGYEVAQVYDGRDVLSRLKRNTETAIIPVLVLSSRSGQLDRHVALELGADDFVDKPMDGRLLMRKIGRMIEVSRARAGGT